jgi:DNA-binding Xre family transcriptional regulator
MSSETMRDLIRLCEFVRNLIMFRIAKRTDVCYNTNHKKAKEEVKDLKVSYKKLWKLLIDKEMTQTEMYRMSGISSGSMTKLRKGQAVSMDVLWKVCVALNCNIEDVVEFEF